MNIKFIEYNDNVYYNSLLDRDESYEFQDNLIEWYKNKYQSENIKLDFSLAIDLKFLDVINI